MAQKYNVRLSGDGIVSATATVDAENAKQATELALKIPESDLDWRVDSLHEEPTVFSVEVVLKKA